MKLLLVAVNAKYIHSNPAIYGLRAYAGQYGENISIKEYTINHSREEILKDIYLQQADLVAFSCYIWNMSLISELTAELKRVQPEIVIWLGGPEVSYHSEQLLRSLPAVDGIVVGEGEQTFLELTSYYMGEGGELDRIKGIVFKKHGMTSEDSLEQNPTRFKIIKTPDREPFSMDELPFPYEDMEAFQNRIIYYESSRGCPYGCSYCLSSVDRRVRYRSTDLVKKELSFFLEQRVRQVKFVDRTFNCDRQRALELWSFLKEKDNGLTNFHFEITADLLSEEELSLLATLRPGQVQLEIGVQTTNPDTMAAIHRRVDFTKLSEHVTRLAKAHNIHLHLDLIAGLPLEDLKSFKRSFNEVYRLKSDQLQLGFLKVLKGSPLEGEAKEYGIVYRELPPYEVLYTGVLSFREVLTLKSVCDMVEVYYNSGQFRYAMEYLNHFYQAPFDLFLALAEYYEEKGYRQFAHSRMKRYDILLDFYREKVLKLVGNDSCNAELQLFGEILLLDLYLREDLKSRPSFAKESLDRERYYKLKQELQLGKEPFHIEHFSFDVMASARKGYPLAREMNLLFRYDRRDPISHSAEITVL